MTLLTLKWPFLHVAKPTEYNSMNREIFYYTALVMCFIQEIFEFSSPIRSDYVPPKESSLTGYPIYYFSLPQFSPYPILSPRFLMTRFDDGGEECVTHKKLISDIWLPTWCDQTCLQCWFCYFKVHFNELLCSLCGLQTVLLHFF